MVLKALMNLGNCETEVLSAINDLDFSSAEHEHHHDHDHHHGRSYREVKHMIQHSGFSSKARETAANIYKCIAEAEAAVHGETLETIHFHEVGRDQAIKNALGIGMALEVIAPDKILTSPVYDGKGTIICSHGEIPVPVPAVRALMSKSTFTFKQADVNTEMVTPSGLASLMGIGAVPDDAELQQEYIIKETEARGTRQTGREGLKVYILKM